MNLITKQNNLTNIKHLIIGLSLMILTSFSYSSELGNHRIIKIQGAGTDNAKVHIGHDETSPATADYNLYVEDGILSEVVEPTLPSQSDFVFAEDYALRSLAAVEQFIKTYKPLPYVQLEKEIINQGYLGATNYDSFLKTNFSKSITKTSDNDPGPLAQALPPHLRNAYDFILATGKALSSTLFRVSEDASTNTITFTFVSTLVAEIKNGILTYYYNGFGGNITAVEGKSTVVLGHELDYNSIPGRITGLSSLDIKFRTDDPMEDNLMGLKRLYFNPADWTMQRNLNWVEAAALRGDIIRFVSDPTNDKIRYETDPDNRDEFLLDVNGQRILTITGEEIQLLEQMGLEWYPEYSEYRFPEANYTDYNCLPNDIKGRFDKQSNSVHSIKFMKNNNVEVQGTGILVNNTKKDGKLYILTAASLFWDEINNRVMNDAEINNSLEEAEFTFFNKRPYCNVINSDNNSTTMTLIGATLKSIQYNVIQTGYSSMADIALLEITENAEFNNLGKDLYFSGIDLNQFGGISQTYNGEITPHAIYDAGIIISHPEINFPQKIFITNEIQKGATITSNGTNQFYSDNSTSDYEWLVKSAHYIFPKVTADIDSGSKGAPLFNPNGNVFGILNYANNYSNLSQEINLIATPMNRASRNIISFLDPDGTNKSTIDGGYHCQRHTRALTYAESSNYQNLTINEPTDNSCVTSCYGIVAGDTSISDGAVYTNVKHATTVDIAIEIDGVYKPLGEHELHGNPTFLFNIYDSGITNLGTYQVRGTYKNGCNELTVYHEVTISSLPDTGSSYYTYANAIYPVNDYLVNKKDISSDYQVSASYNPDATDNEADNVLFETGLAKDIPYATAYGWEFRGDAGYGTITATMPSEYESEVSHLKQGELKMDVYYPKSIAGKTTENLKQLPLIIYAFGGGFVKNSHPELDAKICQWLAARGYVVAAIDYRLGMSIGDGELAKRAPVRAWQDFKAAVQYWRSFPANFSSEHPWKIDPNKVYGLGWSSGGITVLNNMFLTNDKFTEESGAYGYLKSSLNNYFYDSTVCGLGENNQTLFTYNLNEYPTKPVNLTDNQIASLDARVNKALSFAGALPKVDWLSTETNRLAGDIHHINDNIVPFGGGKPFGYLGYIASYYNILNCANGLSDVFGGGDLSQSNFSLLKLEGNEKAGQTSLLTKYHNPQVKFGQSIAREKENTELEPKIMFYIDAFFMKDKCITFPTSGKSILSAGEKLIDINSEPTNQSEIKYLFNEGGGTSKPKVTILENGYIKVYEKSDNPCISESTPIQSYKLN